MRGAGSRLRSAVYLLAGLVVLTVPASAQTISGRVTDQETGDPVEGVRVQLLSGRSDSLSVDFTDGFGEYRLVAPGPGEYRIRASRVGVGEVVTHPFTLQGAGTEVVDLALTFTAIELDALLVRQRPFRWWERDRPARTWEFWERREFYEPLGFGRFLSDGEATRFSDLSDLVAVHAPRMLRCNGRMALYVDGVRMEGSSLQIVNGRIQGDWSALFPLRQVEHLELYPGGLKVPGELVAPGAGCGVVVVWLSSTE